MVLRVRGPGIGKMERKWQLLFKVFGITDITPIMESQPGKTIHNEMETGLNCFP